MKRLFTNRWIMPLAGLLCGLVTGIIFRSVRTSEPKGTAKYLTEIRPVPPSAATAPRSPVPLLSYGELRSSKYTNLEDQVRLQQSALNLSPAEALEMALKHENDCRGPNPFAARLLWYRAAQENPEQVLKAAEKVINNQANPLPLEGIFAAWVETNPAAALAAAEATPKYWNGNHVAAEYCIAAWAERDPAACARALEGKTLTDSSLSKLLAGWTARDPHSALAWVEQRDRKSLPAAYREWSHSDPIHALESALARNPGALTADSDPVSVSCAIAAHRTLIHRLPELAVKIACSNFTGLAENHRPDIIAANLEENMSGAGETLALAMPPGVNRDRAIGFIARQAIRRGETAHVRELFNHLRSSEFPWLMVSDTLLSLAGDDPEMGRDCLLDLKPQMDPKAFARAAEDFNEQVTRTAPSMVVEYESSDREKPN